MPHLKPCAWWDSSLGWLRAGAGISPWNLTDTTPPGQKVTPTLPPFVDMFVDACFPGGSEKDP